MKIEQGFMRRELGEEETGRDEQDDPLGKAAAEQQELGPVDFLYKAVLEDGRSPTTHPLRSGGGWLRKSTDPVLRGVEELAMATGREEILHQP